ncbi:MAG: DEAD/DEAH box helicase [Acidobacteria bacterium]|nr:DEAD/DEAH box helicase [Acidobacteriota bacterium]
MPDTKQSGKNESQPCGPDLLHLFHPPVREWFACSFPAPTRSQALGWAAIARGESTLLLAPTGTGKTLAAFLACIDRILFSPPPPTRARCRVLYVSPLKALAVDVERNLRAPIAGITRIAQQHGIDVYVPRIFIRTGDTPAQDRARFLRQSADILITTPESLYLLLTSSARDRLRVVETVIIDEIHALVPNKRGAHLALSLERLQAICPQPLQRIGLSATQRPLEEVALFLGGFEVVGGDPSTAFRGPRPHDTERGQDAHVLATSPHRHGAASSDLRGQSLEDSLPHFTDDRPPSISHPLIGNAQSWTFAPRPVSMINAGERKPLELRVEVPVEDMAQLSESVVNPSVSTAQGPASVSIWPMIHPRLLQLIRQHHSTLIFVNSRRLAERLAAALNELAGETIVSAHHGSIARLQRLEIEDNLKAGKIPALVATSSLELGIDMGAVDLVIQIEAPPSVASGLQRIGRARHQVGAVSRGVIVPKYRADLVACAAAARSMLRAEVEATRFLRNPLDVLAQQIVAMCAVDDWTTDALYQTVRRAAPFSELSRQPFESVLDMLSGRYPSDAFADLRPRITWDRISGILRGRHGAGRVAIANAGTIPDRGLYGVFLAGAASQQKARVGELDEEMVFESRVGETFLLGASTWRIKEITHDRVQVTPAPGQPGKMPFWHGDRAGRPLGFGRAIGALIRELRALPPPRAVEQLQQHHSLSALAAQNLVTYVQDQLEAGALPDDWTIVVERCRDELGDWRVCILSPFGGKVLAPWAMAIVANVRERRGMEVDTMWSDDGIIIRYPELSQPPELEWLLPDPDRVQELVTGQLGSSTLFASRFREIAARALLLPKRRPGTRVPLWQQRKRAFDLLQVAIQYRSFPMILETYRECLRDVFDMPGLVEIFRQIQNRTLRVVTVDTQKPSPFASSVLFGYIANFIYEGDAPIAERRAQALMVDPGQLRELMGKAERCELFDLATLSELELELQCLADSRKARHPDNLHDMLLRLGDLSAAEISQRVHGAELDSSWIDLLQKEGRILSVPVGMERRFIAVEDAARYRDALGIPLPPGLPASLLVPLQDSMGDLLRRYARSHGSFLTQDVALRFGIPFDLARQELQILQQEGHLLEGEFRPGGQGTEWCNVDVLRALRQKSLARLRRQVEPVEASVLARFLISWHRLIRKRRGPEGLLEVIEQLQGIPIAASLLESEVLPARIHDYKSAHLDLLCAAGEVIWVGVESLGECDGRVALFLTDRARLLRPFLERNEEVKAHGPKPGGRTSALSHPDRNRHERIRSFLRAHGASFFASIHEAAGGGYLGDTLNVLWDLVWRGEVSNDTLLPLRHLHGNRERQRHATGGAFRSRRLVPPAGEGRWSLVSTVLGPESSFTERAAARAQQLLDRYGLLTREVIAAEPVQGGFSTIYSTLKVLEERGRIRRGYFVKGLGAMQFALPQALEGLRDFRELPGEDEVVLLAAADPANPYGSILPWPTLVWPGALSRSVGCYVILVNGALVAYIGRSESQFFVFLPQSEPQRSRVARSVAEALVSWVRSGRRKALFISSVNGAPAPESELAQALLHAGFVSGPRGFMLRRALDARNATNTHE